jgi:hypothetical protein
MKLTRTVKQKNVREVMYWHLKVKRESDKLSYLYHRRSFISHVYQHLPCSRRLLHLPSLQLLYILKQSPHSILHFLYPISISSRPSLF